MKKTTIFLCVLMLSGITSSASGQASLANVWTGTTVPTTTAANVGIGTTSPAARLDIITSGSLPSVKIKNVTSLFGGNATNIIEVYSQMGNVSPPMDPVLLNWMSSGGVFGLRSLSNTNNENRLIYADKTGNVKLANIGLSFVGGPPGAEIHSLNKLGAVRFVDSNSGNDAGGIWGNGYYQLYMYGSLEVSSSVKAQSFITTSDKRLKDNITPLKALSPNLLNINSYSYTYKAKAGGEDKTTDTRKLHFGFIAQEVEKEFPNLVSIDEKGNYALNYVEFIPLLLNELKDQKKEINDLKERMGALEAKINGTSETSKMVPGKEISASSFSLEQNVPNPFNQEMVIRFNASGDNVSIGIYDLGGRQLQTIPVKKGEKQIRVSARTLTPGTYIYNLQVGGKLIDSKKMIVTN